MALTSVWTRPARFRIRPLAGQTVLVTGATGGIGSAIARAFAARGARLVLTGRRADVLESIARRTGGRAIVCDLAAREDLDRLARDATTAAVDVLVANAALPASGLLTDLGRDQLDRLIDVNLRAPIALTHALLPGMIERRRGHLVFISSLAGKAASPSSSMYSATKFGLRGFALGLREDLRPHGIGVSVVLPGFIRGAGMFAETGVELPFGVSTRTPGEVARGVIHAIERNRAEVEVAPLALRAGAMAAGVAPQLAASISRLLGSDRISAEIAAGQRHKR
jgi:uncharacterized protein